MFVKVRSRLRKRGVSESAQTISQYSQLAQSVLTTSTYYAMTMAERNSRTKSTSVAICGAGLVGALNACCLAKRGYEVEVYEKRPDIRTQEVVRGRSINLTLSLRGLEALRGIGLEDAIIKKGMPMYGRMIHDVSGNRRSVPYGTNTQYILSIDRRLLNEVLLTEAERHPNVQIYFSHKVIKCDFNTGTIVSLKDGREEVHHKVDLIIGADGAFSSVRQQMMEFTCFNYQQEYISHGYMEFCIPPTKNNKFAMEVNFLHVWPRNDFMMIALPNLDLTFTTTLLMPFELFDSLKTEKLLLEFFYEKFPDAVPLLGEENIKSTFFSHKPLPLVSIKCRPYNVGSKALLIGDAAHTMVPFYGQALNCGFEDCIILSEMLDKYNGDFGQVLPAFTEYRNPDAMAICDLSMYNYIEMRASLNSPFFLLRKRLDNLLFALFPKSWIPLYTMVSFSRIRYQECLAHKAWQDKVLKELGYLVIGSASLVGILSLWIKLSGQNSS